MTDVGGRSPMIPLTRTPYPSVRSYLVGRREGIHASRLAAIRRLPRGSVGAEIGVWRGDMSATLHRLVRPRRLYLVDPWRFRVDGGRDQGWYGGAVARSQADMDAIHRSVADRFSEQSAEGTVQIVRGSVASLADRVPPAGLDWAYVDGDHSAEGVREDIRILRPLVRPGGYLVFDDYAAPGWWDDGVSVAVDEAVAEARLDLVVRYGKNVVTRRP